eukprot:XP_001690278.1 predicted protein [Chlamydomonas reinhardtii]
MAPQKRLNWLPDREGEVHEDVPFVQATPDVVRLLILQMARGAWSTLARLLQLACLSLDYKPLMAHEMAAAGGTGVVLGGHSVSGAAASPRLAGAVDCGRGAAVSAVHRDKLLAAGALPVVLRLLRRLDVLCDLVAVQELLWLLAYLTDEDALPPGTAPPSGHLAALAIRALHVQVAGHDEGKEALRVAGVLPVLVSLPSRHSATNRSAQQLSGFAGAMPGRNGEMANGHGGAGQAAAAAGATAGEGVGRSAVAAAAEAGDATAARGKGQSPVVAGARLACYGLLLPVLCLATAKTLMCDCEPNQLELAKLGLPQLLVQESADLLHGLTLRKQIQIQSAHLLHHETTGVHHSKLAAALLTLTDLALLHDPGAQDELRAMGGLGVLAALLGSLLRPGAVDVYQLRPATCRTATLALAGNAASQLAAREHGLLPLLGGLLVGLAAARRAAAGRTLPPAAVEQCRLLRALFGLLEAAVELNGGNKDFVRELGGVSLLGDFLRAASDFVTAPPPLPSSLEHGGAGANGAGTGVAGGGGGFGEQPGLGLALFKLLAASDAPTSAAAAEALEWLAPHPGQSTLPALEAPPLEALAADPASGLAVSRQLSGHSRSGGPGSQTWAAWSVGRFFRVPQQLQQQTQAGPDSAALRRFAAAAAAGMASGYRGSGSGALPQDATGGSAAAAAAAAGVGLAWSSPAGSGTTTPRPSHSGVGGVGGGAAWEGSGSGRGAAGLGQASPFAAGAPAPDAGAAAPTGGSGGGAMPRALGPQVSAGGSSVMSDDDELAMIRQEVALLANTTSGLLLHHEAMGVHHSKLAAALLTLTDLVLLHDPGAQPHPGQSTLPALEAPPLEALAADPASGLAVSRQLSGHSRSGGPGSQTWAAWSVGRFFGVPSAASVTGHRLPISTSAMEQQLQQQTQAGPDSAALRRFAAAAAAGMAAGYRGSGGGALPQDANEGLAAAAAAAAGVGLAWSSPAGSGTTTPRPSHSGVGGVGGGAAWEGSGSGRGAAGLGQASPFAAGAPAPDAGAAAPTGGSGGGAMPRALGPQVSAGGSSVMSDDDELAMIRQEVALLANTTSGLFPLTAAYTAPLCNAVFAAACTQWPLTTARSGLVTRLKHNAHQLPRRGTSRTLHPSQPATLIFHAIPTRRGGG